ncbi:4Fe-4S dicluster domain-containing protein [Yersinia pseudotuberculosis]|uniref:4Fe-4S ferredoxin iron-sulfur binding domain protein n=4 Tax=Yersinia pseudotuberculosis complex TaxID=1649845 RepID=A0A0H3B085_YERPY|nr:4Fe-4S binding protein [Yersinia pseudotuberculosis]AJJ60945.1 4Fe-4S binding domain protein [Yersinia pseudotuberculosis YPIII]AYW87468.1 4Fe-4S dicluster domain-containing protein [Yersinia pseudotuberculosis]AYX02020.1 4Fe-4S dicluster domain-containing protein [Yersinia pseudotuberculosis]AZA29776.1 4Fe-4S dicluster domain-containing protein [Yersinia pseudotuberculosis]MBK1425459.1 4Fe-4S binding protein [Yersinia pseudotuberculosis]
MTKNKSVARDERYYKAYLESRTISRRGLFRGLLKGVQPSTTTAPSDITAPPPLRPPYAIDEPHFQQSCTGCGVCVAACEENLIVMVNQRSALNFSTPYFSTPYCSRCQACSTACQTGALSSAEFHIAARPSVKNICQNTYIYCDSCADYCEKQALIWQANQPPTLVTELCDGCGECVFRCPARILEMQI